jgi:hypothetical protein
MMDAQEHWWAEGTALRRGIVDVAQAGWWPPD